MKESDAQKELERIKKINRARAERFLKSKRDKGQNLLRVWVNADKSLVGSLKEVLQNLQRNQIQDLIDSYKSKSNNSKSFKRLNREGYAMEKQILIESK